MKIISYDYNEMKDQLNIEFSTEEDSDSFYRILNLDYTDIKYYSPTIITKEDMSDIDEYFILDLLNQYFEDNDLPKQLTL